MIITFAEIVWFFDDILLGDGSQYLFGGYVGSPLTIIMFRLALGVPTIVHGDIMWQSIRSIVGS